MKKILSILCVALISILTLTSCSSMPRSRDSVENFTFSLVWGIYGSSSYDSESGKLVRNTHVDYPERYTATLNLTEDELDSIYKLIAKIDPVSYPDKYTPLDGGSTPSQTIILTVKYNDVEKTITCEEIPLEGKPIGRKGKNFMDTCNKIVEFLKSTDEWNNIPDPHIYYY